MTAGGWLGKPARYASLPGMPDQTEADKLAAKAARPLRSSKPQRPADFGLFDVSGRSQLDLVEYAAKAGREGENS